MFRFAFPMPSVKLHRHANHKEIIVPRQSPIHRDPHTDGDDFGCLGRNRSKGNRAIVQLLDSARQCLNLGEFSDGEDLVDYLREELEDIEREYDCGCCDTVVKENVMAALTDLIKESKLKDYDGTQIYGW